MVRQVFDLVWAPPRSHLGHAVPSECLQGFDDAGMQYPTPLQQEAAVGHLVRQGVLESVFRLGEKARLIQELRRLEVC